MYFQSNFPERISSPAIKTSPKTQNIMWLNSGQNMAFAHLADGDVYNGIHSQHQEIQYISNAACIGEVMVDQLSGVYVTEERNTL